MSNDVKLKVVYISDRYVKGALEATCTVNGKTKSKQCSLVVHSPEIAFGIVDLWATDMAKELGIEYIKSSLAELMQRIQFGSNRENDSQKSTRKSNGISTGLNRSLLSNRKYLKTEIDRTFKVLGYDRLKGIFQTGIEYINQLEHDRAEGIKNADKAKESMAQAMYLTYVDTKVDMSAFCNDTEIVTRFKELQQAAA